MGKYDFTDNMTALVQNNMSGLSSMYCREDYEQAVRAVKAAPKDARPFRRRVLDDMCEHGGKLTSGAILADGSLLDAIPTRQELLEKLIVVIHDLHHSFPKPADYMERIVFNLAPEYCGDTVRTAILKRFIKGAGFHSRQYNIDAIADWAVDRMTPEARSEYQGASEDKRLDMLLPWLDDTIFSKERLTAVLGPLETLALLADRVKYYTSELDITYSSNDQAGLTYEQLGIDTRSLIDNYFATALGPHISILEVMDMVLEKAGKDLETGSIGQTEEELVSALEKDMISLMRGMYYTDRNGNRSAVADLFKYSKRDKARGLIQQWKLLRICDELAKGEFKMSGATRAALYHFAIMFGMTTKLKDTDVVDPKTDIIKNLFEDYYNDNLIRYLDQDYSDPRYTSRLEKEPTGEGPNFKNYVESIYLYYLYRTDLKLSPGERIDKAEQLRDKCFRLAKKKKEQGVLQLDEGFSGTKEYKRLYVTQMVDLEEKALPEFITSHYHILPSGNGANEAGILVNADEDAAYDNMQDILEDLEDSYDRLFQAGQAITSTDYGKSIDIKPLIEDMRLEGNPFFEWKLAPLLNSRYSQDTDFVRVITKLQERLTKEINWIGARKKEFLVELLHILCTKTSESSPLMIDAVTDELKRTDMTANGPMVIDGIDTLKKVGFDVHRETDDTNGRSWLWIGEKRYGEKLLQDAVDYVSGTYWINMHAAINTMDWLLSLKMEADKRISRTTLIAAYTAYYVTLLEDTEGIDSFPGLSEDFRTSIDPVLEDCRYQTISEKNILDMFVLISIYYYLIENHYRT